MNASADHHKLDLYLEGRPVLITGATSGLGRQFALALASKGGIPILTGRRTERLESLANEIKAMGERAHHITLDVRDIPSLQSATRQAWDLEGHLWGFINNAGVAASAPALEVDEDNYNFVMDTNVKAAFFAARQVGQLMIEGGIKGHIVNIASIAAFKTLQNNAIYCMSKAAIAHMTRCLAHEWARHGVNVNAICPGYIKTEINEDFFESPAGADYIKRFPRRRVGGDQDLNELILYLLSPASHFITGSLMVADDAQMLG